MLRFYTKANSLRCMWCNWLKKTSPTGTTCGWVCAVYSVFVTSVLKDLCLDIQRLSADHWHVGNTIWLLTFGMTRTQFVEWILGQGGSSDEACIAIIKLNQVTVKWMGVFFISVSLTKVKTVPVKLHFRVVIMNNNIHQADQSHALWMSTFLSIYR